MNDNKFEMFVDYEDGAVKCSVNGFKIFEVHFDEDCLPIKSKEQAIIFAKEIANIMDKELVGVNPENYPYPLKYDMDTEFVEGFEGETYSSKEEQESIEDEYTKERFEKFLEEMSK